MAEEAATLATSFGPHAEDSTSTPHAPAFLEKEDG